MEPKRFPKQRMLTQLENVQWTIRDWVFKYAEEHKDEADPLRRTQLRQAVNDLDDILRGLDAVRRSIRAFDASLVFYQKTS